MLYPRKTFDYITVVGGFYNRLFFWTTHVPIHLSVHSPAQAQYLASAQKAAGEVWGKLVNALDQSVDYWLYVHGSSLCLSREAKADNSAKKQEGSQAMMILFAEFKYLWVDIKKIYIVFLESCLIFILIIWKVKASELLPALGWNWQCTGKQNVIGPCCVCQCVS